MALQPAALWLHQEEGRTRASADELAPFIEAALARKPRMAPLAAHEVPVVRASVKAATFDAQRQRQLADTAGRGDG